MFSATWCYVKYPWLQTDQASLDPNSYPPHCYYCATSSTVAVTWRIGPGTENNPRLCPLGHRWRQNTFPVFVRSCQLLQYPLLSSSRYLGKRGWGVGLPAYLGLSVCLSRCLTIIFLSVCLYVYMHVYASLYVQVCLCFACASLSVFCMCKLVCVLYVTVCVRVHSVNVCL